MSQIATLESIFATPIQAIIDADYMAARRASEYIKEFGFNQRNSAEGSNALGSLKETSFSYNTLGTDGKPEQRLVKIPSLSLIPLPLLHVEHADFDFSVRIVSSEQNEDGKLSAALVPQRNSQNANASTPHLDANINVKMKVVQSDIPAGISNLLALMGSNTSNTPLDKISINDPLLKFRNGEERSSSLRLTDPNGNPIKNALVSVSYDETSGISLLQNHKQWGNGCSMLTDENGEIRYRVAYYIDDNAEKPGTVHEIKFSHEDMTSAIQKIYVE